MDTVTPGQQQISRGLIVSHGTLGEGHLKLFLYKYAKQAKDLTEEFS